MISRQTGNELRDTVISQEDFTDSVSKVASSLCLCQCVLVLELACFKWSIILRPNILKLDILHNSTYFGDRMPTYGRPVYMLGSPMVYVDHMN